MQVFVWCMLFYAVRVFWNMDNFFLFLDTRLTRSINVKFMTSVGSSQCRGGAFLWHGCQRGILLALVTSDRAASSRNIGMMLEAFPDLGLGAPAPEPVAVVTDLGELTLMPHEEYVFIDKLPSGRQCITHLLALERLELWGGREVLFCWSDIAGISIRNHWFARRYLILGCPLWFRIFILTSPKHHPNITETSSKHHPSIISIIVTSPRHHHHIPNHNHKCIQTYVYVYIYIYIYIYMLLNVPRPRVTRREGILPVGLLSSL